MNIIITGTSRGIGKDLAEYYLTEGHNVMGCSRGDTSVAHSNYRHSLLSVLDEEAVVEWVADAHKQMGRIDMAIANAGKVFASSLMLATDSDKAANTIAVSLMGTYHVCKETAKKMVRNKFGRIITVSSMTVPLHAIGTVAYSSAKAGIEEMTRIMAREFAPYNITVNCIAPSIYDGGGSSAYRLDPELHDKILKTLVIQRPITLWEMTSAIELFIKNDALTGQILRFGTV